MMAVLIWQTFYRKIITKWLRQWLNEVLMNLVIESLLAVHSVYFISQKWISDPVFVKHIIYIHGIDTIKEVSMVIRGPRAEASTCTEWRAFIDSLSNQWMIHFESSEYSAQGIGSSTFFARLWPWETNNWLVPPAVFRCRYSYISSMDRSSFELSRRRATQSKYAQLRMVRWHLASGYLCS